MTYLTLQNRKLIVICICLQNHIGSSHHCYNFHLIQRLLNNMILFAWYISKPRTCTHQSENSPRRYCIIDKKYAPFWAFISNMTLPSLLFAHRNEILFYIILQRKGLYANILTYLAWHETNAYYFLLKLNRYDCGFMRSNQYDFLIQIAMDLGKLALIPHRKVIYVNIHQSQNNE